MKPHDFYNLLENRIKLARMKNGIHTYPDDFIKRYNDCLDLLENLSEQVNSALELKMQLEKEQFNYTQSKEE